jgi:putative ABC transport system permease protein
LLETAQRIPGVERTALTLSLPLWGYRIGPIDVPGLDSVLAQRVLSDLPMNAVSPDYFATMGTRIIRGRGVHRTDVSGAPGAIVINQAMARILWPGKDAIGQCVRIVTIPGCTYVVGIAADTRATQLTGDQQPFYYLSAAQFHPEETSLLVRTRGDASRQAANVRQMLQREMPGGSYVTVAPFADVVADQTRSWRLGATMFVAFGLLALVLAAVGLYSVVAYDVARRTHELGVRRALGAQRSDVVWFVVRRGLVVGAVGIAIGAALSWIAGARFEGMLFGVSGRDVEVLLLVAMAMFVVAIVASLVPARRAARVDPNVALRAE